MINSRIKRRRSGEKIIGILIYHNKKIRCKNIKDLSTLYNLPTGSEKMKQFKNTTLNHNFLHGYKFCSYIPILNSKKRSVKKMIKEYFEDHDDKYNISK